MVALGGERGSGLDLSNSVALQSSLLFCCGGEGGWGENFSSSGSSSSSSNSSNSSNSSHRIYHNRYF